MKIIVRAATIFLLTCTLGGCLLISPFSNQILSSRTAGIPFQAWATTNTVPLVVECMPTNRFGPPISSHGPWAQVTTIPVSASASLDLQGAKMYSAAKTISLPESCWYLNNSNNWYYTSIRVMRNGSEYYTLDREGISCVTESVGESGRWASWLSDSCALTYSNSNTALGFVVIRTQG